MQIIAKVYEHNITESDLQVECNRLAPDPSLQDEELKKEALTRLIDRALLVHEAAKMGFEATDEEFDTALLEILDLGSTGIKPAEYTDDKPARMLEDMVRDQIILKKYIRMICEQDIMISEDQLRAFYEEQKELFLPIEEVRASHILIKGRDASSLQKVQDLRASIHNPDEFIEASQKVSDCPSNCNCGDLGFFPRSRLVKEIEDVAFSLEINQISQPFLSEHGYHLLMVTDRRIRKREYEDLKDVLKLRLLQIEREFQIVKTIKELRLSASNQLLIIDQRFTDII